MKSADSMFSRARDERGQPLAERLILPFVAMVGVLTTSMAGLAIAAA